MRSPRGSPNTVYASSNVTPCFRALDSAFFESHSNRYPTRTPRNNPSYTSIASLPEGTSSQTHSLFPRPCQFSGPLPGPPPCRTLSYRSSRLKWYNQGGGRQACAGSRIKTRSSLRHPRSPSGGGRAASRPLSPPESLPAGIIGGPARLFLAGLGTAPYMVCFLSFLPQNRPFPLDV